MTAEPHDGTEEQGRRSSASSGTRPDLKDRVRLGVATALARAIPRERAGEFGILVYHRVAEVEAHGARPTWNVTPNRLRAQLEGLLSAGFAPWSLDRVLTATSTGEPLPARAFVVTFDDGYLNNLTRALPILEELQVPATIFVATAFLDSGRPFPSDDWMLAGSAGVAPDSWRPMTTDQVRQALESPLITIGSHTHTHRDLRADPGEFRRDVDLSAALLRERFGIGSAPFAFPFGYSTPALLDAARAAGFTCALTTQPFPVSPDASPYGWGRFTVYETDSATTLRAKLDGWYSRFRRDPAANDRSRPTAASGTAPTDRRPASMRHAGTPEMP